MSTDVVFGCLVDRISVVGTQYMIMGNLKYCRLTSQFTVIKMKDIDQTYLLLFVFIAIPLM